MAALSRSSSRRSSNGSGGGHYPDQIGHNNPILTEDLVKTAAQVFDSALVFKLVFAGRGVNTIRPTALHGCVNVTEIDFTSNKLDRIQGLDKCKALRKLTLTGNRIDSVEGLEKLESLEVLQLQGNRIERLQDLSLDLLAALPKLTCLYLENIDGSMSNPVTKLPGYRQAVLNALPRLKNLDGERRPRETGYSSAAAAAIEAAAEAEMDVDISDLYLPAPTPWLEGWSWQEPGKEMDSLLKGVHTQLKGAELKIEQCRTLLKGVREEQSRVAKRTGKSLGRTSSKS